MNLQVGSIVRIHHPDFASPVTINIEVIHAPRSIAPTFIYGGWTVVGENDPHSEPRWVTFVEHQVIPRPVEAKAQLLKNMVDRLEALGGISSWTLVGKDQNGTLLVGMDADTTVKQAIDLFFEAVLDLGKWDRPLKPGEIVQVPANKG